MLKSLKRKKLHESVSEELLKYIVDNGLGQGDRLPSERFFCEQFQVSRASFREAVKKLESYGMIEVRPGSGMYVRTEKTLLGEMADLKLRVSLELRSLLEMLDLREMMEQYAIEQIVNQGRSDCLEQLETIVEEYDAIRDSGGIPRREDFLFHKTLYEGSGNLLLIKLYQSMEDLEKLWSDRVIDSVSVPIFGRETEPLHRQMLDAMKQGDAKTAKRFMRKHFEIMRNDLYALDDRLFQ